MCVVQVGTLGYSVPINISNSRSFSFTYGHGCLCFTYGRDSPTWNMQQVQQLIQLDPTQDQTDPIQPMQPTSSGTNKTRPDKKRSKQCRYAIEVILIYFNTLFAIGAIPTRFIKSGKFLTQPDTILSNPWIDLTHDCLGFNPN